MDLFVINRYRDPDEVLDTEKQESKHLDILKKKIEERKKAINSQKKSNLSHQIPVENYESDKLISLTQSTSIVENISNNTDEGVNEKTKDNKDYKTIKNVEKPSHELKALGTVNFLKRDKVNRVLPYWLAHPYVISTDLQNLSSSVSSIVWLHDSLKTVLLSEGITHLFPVQEKVVPYVLKEHTKPYPYWPHDVCVSAPTGSGKTLSFVLPIIQVLMNEIGREIRALVVLPVQELATQVAQVFKKYTSRTKLKVALLSGSVPLRQEQQHILRYTESSGWVSEVDILVCTAGRLVEHISNTEGFSLKKLKFLVIDEADRIMDNIQNDWLYHLDKHIKLENNLMTGKIGNLNWKHLNEQRSPPHKLLFSATLSQDPEKLEQWCLFQPKLFSSAATSEFEDEADITKYTTPSELKEEFVTCAPEEKPLVLYHFLVEKKWNKVLCFTNSSQSAHRLTVLLNTWGSGNLQVAELSASLDRTKRELVLKKFTNSEINVLIGTDALARGIDVPNCDYVVSYDPPKNIKTYIHRVGRTGRAGRFGHAVTLLLQNQTTLFKDILQSGNKEQIAQMKIEPEVFNRLSEGYENALHQTKLRVRAEIETKVKKSIGLKRGYRNKKVKSRV